MPRTQAEIQGDRQRPAHHASDRAGGALGAERGLGHGGERHGRHDGQRHDHGRGLHLDHARRAVQPQLQPAARQPTLVLPANGGTGVLTAPDLTVGVSDPDSTNLTVTFYGRAKTALRARTSPSSPCPIRSITPPQQLTTCQLPSINAQMNWVVGSRARATSSYVSHLGDMSIPATRCNTVDRGDDCLRHPHSGGCRMVLRPGNHDGAPGCHC